MRGEEKIVFSNAFQCFCLVIWLTDVNIHGNAEEWRDLPLKNEDDSLHAGFLPSFIRTACFSIVFSIIHAITLTTSLERELGEPPLISRTVGNETLHLDLLLPGEYFKHGAVLLCFDYYYFFLFSSPIMFTFLTLLGIADFMQTSLAVQCASLEGEDGSLTEWDILYFSGSIL